MQLHETESDRIAQQEIMDAWCAHFRMRSEFMYHTGRYKFDYGIYSNDWSLLGVAEVKDRSRAFDTIIMDLSKAKHLMEYVDIGIRAFFIVRIEGQVLHYEFTKESRVLLTSARMHHSKQRQTDRGPVIDIPFQHFLGI